MHPTTIQLLIYNLYSRCKAASFDADRQHGFVGNPQPAVPLVLRQRAEDVGSDGPADGRRDCGKRPPQGRALLHRVPELLRVVENPPHGHALGTHLAKARRPQRLFHGSRLAEAKKIGGPRRWVERVVPFEGAADDPQRVDLALRAPDGDGDAPARDQHAVHLPEGALGVRHQHEPEPADHPIEGQAFEGEALGIHLVELRVPHAEGARPGAGPPQHGRGEVHARYQAARPHAAGDGECRLARPRLHVQLRQDRLPDRIGPGPRQLVQLRLKRLGRDRLILLGDPAPDSQVQFGPADLLREQVVDPQLILGERLRLHLRADHLDELAQLPAVPNSFELGPRELDRHLDAPFPASLLDVEHTPHDARAVRRFFRAEEERDSKLVGHRAAEYWEISRRVNEPWLSFNRWVILDYRMSPEPTGWRRAGRLQASLRGCNAEATRCSRAGDTAWAPRCSAGRTAGSAGPRRRNAQLRWAMRGQDPLIFAAPTSPLPPTPSTPAPGSRTARSPPASPPTSASHTP